MVEILDVQNLKLHKKTALLKFFLNGVKGVDEGGIDFGIFTGGT